MRKLKNRGKALIVGGGLMLGGQGVEASAQNNMNIQKDSKEVFEKKNDVLYDNLSISEAISEAIDHEYNKFANSEEGTQLIQFYGSKQIIDKSISEKGEKLKNIQESVVKSKIKRTLEYILEDITKRPDYYGTFDSKGRFILKNDVIAKEMETKLESEFKDYLSTLSRREGHNSVGEFFLGGVVGFATFNLLVLFSLRGWLALIELIFIILPKLCREA